MLKRFIGAVIAILVVFMAISTATANSTQTIDLVTGEWEPYSGSQLPRKGISSEIVEAVFNDMGYEPNITFLPFYLGYEKTLSGDFSGTFPYFYTPEREKIFYYSSKPLFQVLTSFYYNKSDSELKEKNELGTALAVSDLHNYCVGLIQGYDYGAIEDEIVEKGKYRRYNTEVNAFRDLVGGLTGGDTDIGVVEDTCGRGVKLQALPSAKQVGEIILDENFRDERYLIGELNVALKEEDKNKDVYFITQRSEKGKKLIEQFNASLEKLIDNDFIATLEKNAQSLDGLDSSGLVRLTGTDAIPLVVGYEAASTKISCPTRTGLWRNRNRQLIYNENCGYLIPKGTRALVIEWGEPFTKPGQVEIFDQLLKPSKVKILEGPLKNKELYVSNVYIEFE